MPTYVYACTECGHRFEAVQSFADDSLTECPECEGRLRKVFNSVGVVFKGSGFYRTDSRSGKGAKKPAAAAAKSEKSDGSSSDAGSSTSEAPAATSAPEAKPNGSSSSSKPGGATVAASA